MPDEQSPKVSDQTSLDVREAGLQEGKTLRDRLVEIANETLAWTQRMWELDKCMAKYERMASMYTDGEVWKESVKTEKDTIMHRKKEIQESLQELETELAELQDRIAVEGVSSLWTQSSAQQSTGSDIRNC